MATYYLAPALNGGSDSNSGTTTGSPWLTLEKLWTVIAAGDTAYLRGGTFLYTEQQNITGKNGTAGNLIKIWAFPGETPIISRATPWTKGTSGNPNKDRFGIYFEGDYVYWRAIEMTGFTQDDGYVWGAMNAFDFNNCIFEQLDIHHNGGPVYFSGTSTGNLVLNCDFYEQYDPITGPPSGDPYGNADGLNFENIPYGCSNIVRGCRFWNNSDDGLDLYGSDGYFLVENCWAWGNGYRENRTTVGGNGGGFKLGGSTLNWESYPTYTFVRIQNCIAWSNARWGFDNNESELIIEVYNNVAWYNGHGEEWYGGFHFSFGGVAPDEGAPYIIRNNIGYLSNSSKDNWAGNIDFVDHNSWNAPFGDDGWESAETTADLTDDFVSIDGSEMIQSRQPNGELPAIDFLHLVSSSPLINAGVNVGLPYFGTAPDLGAFEYDEETSLLSGLLLFWKCDEITGYLADFSGNGKTGITTDLTYGQTGIGGDAVSFNGTTSYVVTTNPPVSLGFSISLWLKTSDADPNRIAFGGGWRLYHDNGLISIFLSDSGEANAVEFVFAGDWNDNAWHHIVVTFDSTNVLGYVDTVNKLTDTWNFVIHAETWEPDLYVGWNQDVQYMAMVINNFGIWGRALTGAEILVLYNTGIGGPITKIYVTSIVVSGALNATTIVTYHGSLQMSAAILPVDADDQTVTWSVISGTGTANINSTGLLTALTDGTVTVRATANDSMGVYGNKVITLTNQYIVSQGYTITPYQYGNIPLYRFYIYEGPTSATYEVFPLNFLSTSLVDEREGKNVFYRKKFNGTLLFGTNSKVIDYDDGVTVHNRREDWDLLWAIERFDPCAILYFDIHKIVGGVVEEYWFGSFSTTDGIFDIDKCTFEVTPIVNDDYVHLLDEADIQRNMLYVTPEVSTETWSTLHRHYTHNRWLARGTVPPTLDNNNVIWYLADQILPGVIVTSYFFTDAINPVTLDDNLLLYLMIAQKSDIIRPTSTNPATSALISWNGLMDILWGMFQVRWDYDGTTIRVEHVSFFPTAAAVDLRTQLSCVESNKYSYLKDKMPKYEKFSFMEADGINFVNNVIYYNNTCVNQDPESNSVETSVNVTTDLEYIINNPEAISDEGFVILCNYLDVTYFVRVGISPLFGPNQLNIDMSWTNLQNSYFRHERVLIEGYLLGILTTFWTAQKTKTQDCSAILCSTFDPASEIITELGETYFAGARGMVQKAERRPSGEVKLSLLYGPAGNLNTGVENLFSLFGYLEMQDGAFPKDTIHIDFTFSDLVPAGGIDIRVCEVVFDDLGALNYTGAWNNINFAVGVRTQVFNHVLETPLLAGWTISIEIKYTLTDINRVYLNPDETWSYDPPFIYTGI